MSSIIEFFTAPGDDAAAAVADHGPAGKYQIARYGNFDPVTTVGEWESSFSIVRDHDPRLTAGTSDRYPSGTRASVWINRVRQLFAIPHLANDSAFRRKFAPSFRQTTTTATI